MSDDTFPPGGFDDDTGHDHHPGDTRGPAHPDHAIHDNEIHDDNPDDEVQDVHEPASTTDDDITLAIDEVLADTESAYPDDLIGTLDELGVDRVEFLDTMHLLGLDQAPDGRSIVITLERLGVDAHLEFTDVDRLASHLAGGAEIRLSSGHVLTELDDLTDEAVLERDGATSRLALATLEDAWTDHGFESVVTRTDERTVVLLPVTADPRSGGMSG